MPLSHAATMRDCDHHLSFIITARPTPVNVRTGFVACRSSRRSPSAKASEQIRMHELDMKQVRRPSVRDSASSQAWAAARSCTQRIGVNRCCCRVCDSETNGKHHCDFALRILHMPPRHYTTTLQLSESQSAQSVEAQRQGNAELDSWQQQTVAALEVRLILSGRSDPKSTMPL